MKRRYLQLSFLRSISFFILCLSANAILAQTTLKIQDENGDPLIGVEVFTKDFSFADLTDEYGELSTPAGLDTVYLKFIGFEDQIINLLDYQGPIKMKSSSLFVDEVLIIGRTGLREEEIPYQVLAIDAKEIQLTNSQNSADALANNGGVYVQKSQMGGGSPVLRGFEANKVLLVLDGVRLNNAIYRSGHLQNAITIDQAVLERMEVIFGAGSLNYGSDALGGVVHFRSKDPKLNFDPLKSASISSGYYIRHSTANREKSIHYDFSYSKENWGMLSSVSASSYEDLFAGGRRNHPYKDFGKRFEYVENINGMDTVLNNFQRNVQKGTGYDQLDLLQKFLFQLTDSTRLTLNAQYSTSSKVPRYDRLTERDSNDELRFAEWYYGPQNRLLLSARLEHKSTSPLFDRLIFIPSFQRIDEDRIDRDFQSNSRNHQLEDVKVYGATLDFEKNLNPQFGLSYGLDMQHNQVESEAFTEDTQTAIKDFNVLSRYPSAGSSLSSYGLFGKITLKNKDQNLISNTGLRFSTTHVKMKYDSNDPFPWPQGFVDGLTATNSALVASTGINYNMTNQWQLHALLATAYRAPNIDDMAKIRVKLNEVSVPNLDLEPERSYNAEIGIAKRFKKNNYVQATAFYTALDNVIIREALPLPDGSTYILDGTDSIFTFGNINADKGFIYGLSTDGRLTLSRQLEAFGSFNYTFGRADGENGQRPLSHIPPAFGKLGVDWKYQNLDLSFVLRYNFKKPLSEFGDSTDNPDLATPEGSFEWATYNIYVRYPYFDWLEISVGAENIMNLHYRSFSSGVSAPGRNLILSLRGRF